MHEELASAADLLEDAAADADAHADRLGDLADQLRSLADRDRGVDHGRLARVQSALDEIQPEVSDTAAATIHEADDAITSFRETIEGV